MKRSFWSALLVVGGAALTLSACDSGTFEELDKAPLAFQHDSSKPRAQVVACISGKLSKFGSDYGRFPDIDFGVTRLTLGGEDGNHYRNYYRIDVIDEGHGSRVSVRHSKAVDNNMTVRDLSDIVEGCTG
ncbi:MAG: hypothetical protein ACRYHA_34250 [Janthinobacterium lividum]